MTTANPTLGPEDLYEGLESGPCGCTHQASTVPPGVIVSRLKINAREMLPAALAGEPLEAIAEPMPAAEAPPPLVQAAAEAPPPLVQEVQAAAEDPRRAVCMPWVKIERDPQRFKACMHLAEQLGRVETSKQLYEIIRQQLEREDQEVYYVIALDTQLMLRGIAEVARGARDRVLTPIQDTVRYSIAFAQLYGAMGIAIAHNHPSGQTRPSDADKDVTKAVQHMADAVELLFLDHIIVGSDGYYSFRDAGLIRQERMAADR